jgi:PTS system nitrogen regulatory IIA component
MNLLDLIRPDAVIVGVRAGDKAQLLAELARQTAMRLPLVADVVLGALVAREKLGSTGLGRGFALPHARVEGLDRLFGLFVRLARPIDFEAIDGECVDLVCLLLIPPAAGSDHVAALASVARVMRQDSTLQRVRKARDAAALYAHLEAAVA